MLVAGICAKKTVVLGLIFALVAAGCGGENPEGNQGAGGPMTGEARGPATRVLVTSDDPSLPDGCRPREIAELVLDFVDAFNRGDRDRLSRLFFISEGPSPPDFSEGGYYPWSWFSVTEVGEGGRIENGFVTYDQGKLLRYFAERHRHGERLGLIKLSSTQAGLLGKENNVGFVYALTREA